MSHPSEFTYSIIRKIAPLFILLLAFFLQMRYLAELQTAFPDSFGQQPFCGVDAVAHTERAAGLLDGSLPGDDTYYFIPLYPLYLAVLKKFLGDSLLLPVFIQALLQLAGIAALYGIGRSLFSSLTGALASLGLATYNYYLFYLPCYDQVLLTVPFLSLAVFFLVKYGRYQKSGWLPAAGLALAVAALSRPTILAIFPVIALWLYHGSRKSKIQNPKSKIVRQIILLTLPFLILVSPITWHNYRVSGRFILLSDNFDVNLFTGNNPDATGLDSLAHVQSQPAVVRFKALYLRVGAGETTLIAEVLRYIAEQPADWVALTLTKTWLWFGETDERLVSPFFPLTVNQSNTLGLLPLEWRAMVVAALLGVLLVPRPFLRQTWLLWLVYGLLSAATILFFIQLRFRLPFVPFVLLSGASLLAVARQWKQQRPRYFWGTLIVLLFLYPIVPTLWVFILLFAGLSLWPDKLTSVPGLKSVDVSFVVRHSSFVIRFLAICLYLLIIGLWVRTSAADVSQTIDHYLGPPLVGSGVLGQTFQPDCEGLNRIDLTLGVFENSRHDQPVTFYLVSDLSAQEILFSETFEGSLVRDYQKKSFSFSPITDSAGRTYFFFIASPTSTPQNAITVRGYTDIPIDRYPAGNAFAGQLGTLQRVEADFAFKAYCKRGIWPRLWTALMSVF